MSGSSGSGTPNTRDTTGESLTRSTGGSRAPRRRLIGVGAAVAIAVVLLAAGLGGGYFLGQAYGGNSSSSGAKYTITETGSTLIWPLMELWGPNYTALNPNIQVSAQGTGSGTGISSAESGVVDIGGTDAYLDLANATKYGLINVPVAVSSQLIYYNLPGITTHLNLNGTVIAMIYEGTITNWNDPLIQAANPGVSLPNQAIVPIHRLDGSGDTFMFTSFCFLSWSGWTHGWGTTVSWLGTSPGASGNGGMVTKLQQTPYGIAYIGISYSSEAAAAGLSYAALGDQAANVNGTNPANYVLPTPANVQQDVNLGLQHLQPPSVAISLILGGVSGAIVTASDHGRGGTLPTAQYPTPYPDTNLEYTLIKIAPANPSKQAWVVSFLQWALTFGNTATYMTQVNFLPLPANVAGYDLQALAQVQVSA